MTVERTANYIVVRLPNHSNISVEEIERFLNYLRYKELIAQSKASQAQVDNLAQEVKKGWWEKNKHKLGLT